jgi:hypothetical protein
MTNMMTIVVDSTGKVYWDMTDKKVRFAVLDHFGKRVNWTPTEEDKVKFANVGRWACRSRIASSWPWIVAPTGRSSRDSSKASHTDSTNNQLRDWITTTRGIFYNVRQGEPHRGAEGRWQHQLLPGGEVIRIFQSPGHQDQQASR